MSGEIAIRTERRTRIVTMTRPAARNALTVTLLGALQGALDDARVDPGVRCVVLTGAGEHFCAGADLHDVLGSPERAGGAAAILDRFQAVIRGIASLPKPVIARMEGAAVGFGADLACACDLRIASTSAYLQEKFVDLGLMPDGGGTFWLPRLLGTATAMRMVLLGERVSAMELHRLGAVVDAVPSSELEQATNALAVRLEAGPSLAYAAVKEAVYASWGSLDEALARERERQLALLRSRDFAEGLTAWREKRTPRFSGS